MTKKSVRFVAQIDDLEVMTETAAASFVNNRLRKLDEEMIATILRGTAEKGDDQQVDQKQS